MDRVVGVLNKLEVSSEPCALFAETIADVIPVRIDYADGFARYVGRIMRDLDLSQSTPQWMQERLRRSGIRSLGPAVDVTNYVLLELGQPMTAFDLNMIDGGMLVPMGKD